MDKLNIEEIAERAHNKAFSKIVNIQNNIKRVNKEIKAGGDGSVPVDLLRKSLVNMENNLQTWEYIAKLIETNDFRQPIKTNVEMLHGMMGLSDPNYLEVDYEQVYNGDLPIG